MELKAGMKVKLTYYVGRSNREAHGKRLEVAEKQSAGKTLSTRPHQGCFQNPVLINCDHIRGHIADVHVKKRGKFRIVEVNLVIA